MLKRGSTDVSVAYLSLLSALLAPIIYLLVQPPQVPLNMGVACVSGLVAFAVAAVLGTLVGSAFPVRRSSK